MRTTSATVRNQRGLFQWGQWKRPLGGEVEMWSTHALERGPEWTTARRNPRTGEKEQAVIGIPTMIALDTNCRIP